MPLTRLKRTALGICIAACVLLAACTNPVEKKIDGFLLDLESASLPRVDAGLRGLHDLGPAAARAVPAVARVLKSGHPALRPPAAVVLAKIDPSGRESHAHLKEALLALEPPTRAQAARGIGLIEMPLDPKTREILSQLEKDPDKSVRAFVFWTLSVKEPGEKRYARELRAVFQSGTPPERALAVNLIGDLLARGLESDIAILSQALDDPAAVVKEEAVTAAVRQGERAKPAIPALMRAFEHPDDAVHRKAVQAMRLIDPSGDLLLPEFRRRVAHAETRVRLEAIANIGRYEQKGLTARTELIGALNDPVTHVRREAARSLGNLGPEARASAALSARMNDASPEVAWASAEALGRMGSDALPFIRPLLSAATPAGLRQKAVYALGKTEPRGPEVEELLKKTAEDPDSEVSTTAKAALGLK